MPYSGGSPTSQIFRTGRLRRRLESDCAICFDNVWFEIGGHQVLENVSFHIPPGITEVIMGPSGIGKSTILRLILGLMRPQKGDIKILGKSVVNGKNRDLNDLRKRIGVVFQNGALFDSLTIGENVAYGLIEHTRMSFDEIEPKARAFLRLVGLDPDFVLDKLPAQLSLGMQRRVAIARALAFNEPEILLYDEPTTGLDPVSVETVTDVMLRLQKELQVTSIAVTHEIPHALKVADRFLFLYDRGVAFEGTREELVVAENEALVEFLRPFRVSVERAYRSFFDGEDKS